VPAEQKKTREKKKKKDGAVFVDVKTKGRIGLRLR